MFAKLWNDESGVVTVEYLFLVTIVGIGLVVGLTAVRNSVDAELVELGNAITGLSQGYTVEGVSGCSATTASSTVTDTSSNEGTFAANAAAAITTTVSISSCP